MTHSMLQRSATHPNIKGICGHLQSQSQSETTVDPAAIQGVLQGHRHGPRRRCRSRRVYLPLNLSDLSAWYNGKRGAGRGPSANSNVIGVNSVSHKKQPRRPRVSSAKRLNQHPIPACDKPVTRGEPPLQNVRAKPSIHSRWIAWRQLPWRERQTFLAATVLMPVMAATAHYREEPYRQELLARNCLKGRRRQRYRRVSFQCCR